MEKLAFSCNCDHCLRVSDQSEGIAHLFSYALADLDTNSSLTRSRQELTGIQNCNTKLRPLRQAGAVVRQEPQPLQARVGKHCGLK